MSLPGNVFPVNRKCRVIAAITRGGPVPAFVICREPGIRMIETFVLIPVMIIPVRGR